MKKHKPDNIVFDTESDRYNASLLPYASSVGAPSIKIEDNKSWKERGVSKVNKKIGLKFQELKNLISINSLFLMKKKIMIGIIILVFLYVWAELGVGIFFQDSWGGD